MTDQRPGLAPTDLAVDHALSRLAEGVRLLIAITPVDVAEEKARFLADGTEPEFTYREPDTDPAVLTAEIEAIDVDGVEDVTLAHLLRSKRDEMRLQARLLAQRCTPEFRSTSELLFGGVDDRLREVATAIVSAVPAPVEDRAKVGAQAVHERAMVEIEAYRQTDPDVEMHSRIRDDVTGVLVEGDSLLISTDARVDTVRLDALVHHEVGTHLVTHANGSRQPVTLLSNGFAGYDETQEGLAVLGEIACGGLTVSRLRQLGGRVLAVDRMLAGASFGENHAALVSEGFSPGGAFTTAMRVHRAGGLTKDAIYLRGLLELLDHVRDGGELEPFFLGKFRLRDLPLVADLRDRGLLEPPALRPRHLADEAAAARIHEAAHADSLLDLAQH